MSVGSTVFYDYDDNGVQDFGDGGTSGVTVQLYDSANNLLATDVTDSNGDYYFGNLESGQYYVHIPTPPADAPTSSAGFDATDTVDGNDNGQQPGGSGAPTFSAAFTLTGDSEPTDGDTETAQGNALDDGDDENGNMTIDFGFYRPHVVPSIVVEKIRNTPDPVIPGATVTFTIRITNTGSTTGTLVPLTDTYSTAYLTYVGLRTTPESDTTANNGQIVWSDLTQATPNGFGMDFAPNDVWDIVVEFAARLDTTSLPNNWTVNTAQVFTEVATDTVRIFAPTSVLLSSRDVAMTDDGIQLSWSTVGETELIGFHVLRLDESGGEPVRLTDDDQMILAQGSASGTGYQFVDATGDVDAEHHYVLEMVMADGHVR
ncbi:MAG: SdrD B-like domain-containing protein [Chloroflexota bacterium]